MTRLITLLGFREFCRIFAALVFTDLMAATTPPTSSDTKDTGYTPGNDGFTRWRNWFSLLTGNMSEQGKGLYRAARDERMEEADCKRCESQRDYLLQYSTCDCNHLRSWLTRLSLGPVVLFMRDKINQLGGDVHNGNVRCRRCTSRQSGGFDPNFGILICANELRNRGHLEDTMAHGTQISGMNKN